MNCLFLIFSIVLPAGIMTETTSYSIWEITDRYNLGETTEVLIPTTLDTTNEELVDLDEDLNRTSTEARNRINEFLKTGDLQIGKTAQNITEEYVENSKLLSNVDEIPKSDVNNRLSELKDMEFKLQELNTIFESASNLSSVYDTFISETKLNETAKNETLKIYEERLGELETKWNSSNITTGLQFPWKYLYNIIKVTDDVSPQSSKANELDNIFKYYIYPCVYIIILIIGVIGNGTLILMFIRHSEIRTPPNLLIFNLAIADMMNLFINAPIYYVIRFKSADIFFVAESCKVFAIFRFLIHSLIEVSVVSISAQRYFATISAMRTTEGICRMSGQMVAVMYLVTVWCISLMIALLPTYFIYEFRDGLCFPFIKDHNSTVAFDIFSFSFNCAFLPAMLVVFSILTARLLKKSAREFPCELRNSRQELARYRSARVVIALAIVYIVTFIPRCTFFFTVSFFSIDNSSITLKVLDEVTNYLIFSNSCMNPIALYTASGMFRKLFQKYLFKFRRKHDNDSQCSKNKASRTTSEEQMSAESEN